MTKQIYLIDGPPDHADSQLIPNYASGDDVILVKGYCDFFPSYTEHEIRKEISKTLQQKFPLITLTIFYFVKRVRSTIVTPVAKIVINGFSTSELKELYG